MQKKRIPAQDGPPGKNRKESDRIMIPFRISKTGHQLVELSLGAKMLKLLIDTGAGVNVIDIGAAEKFGIKTRGSKKDSAGLGTSSHQSLKLEPIVVDFGDIPIKLEIVGMDLRHVQAAGGKAGFDGLIGGPFLIRHRALMDFGSRMLSFDRTPSPRKTAAPKDHSKVRKPKATSAKKAANKK